MKKFEDYENFEQFAKDVNRELTELLKEHNTVDHAYYGKGFFTWIEARLDAALDIYVTIDFASQTPGKHTFRYNFIIEHGFVEATDEVKISWLNTEPFAKRSGMQSVMRTEDLLKSADKRQKQKPQQRNRLRKKKRLLSDSTMNLQK